ncbi:MAG TPA: hypothetical protein VFA26_14680 [Gemmataceae bacterium]|nr:hypothetical protein [Gemmataceae bacterium]
MKARGTGVGAVALAAALLGCGCISRPTVKVSTNAPQEPQQPRPPGMPFAGPGAGKMFPSVGRLSPTNDLSQFGKFYLLQAQTDGPPKKLDDLPDLKRDLPHVARGIQEGYYVVNWGANPANAPAGTSNTVLAYVWDAPQKGGVVVKLDGSVANVTAEQFAQLAKP